MKVLVTGANGFVGKTIVAELYKDSHEVFAIGRSDNLNTEFIRPGNYFKADISECKKLVETKNLTDIDTIIHCAGLAHQFGKVEKEDFWRANVAGTKNIADLAVHLKAGHFILISSVSVYGGNIIEKSSFGEDSKCIPKDFYAQSKLESERIAEKILSEKGIKLTILRPATVIGEGDPGNFLRLIRAIDGKKFVWIGKGKNRKSLVHKIDVAQACLCVLGGKSRASETFNVSGEPLTMDEIVDCIAHRLARKIPPISIPLPVLRKAFELNAGLFKINKLLKLEETIKKWTAEDVYSGEKLKRKYGYEAKIPVKDAILREVEWYLADKLSKK